MQSRFTDLSPALIDLTAAKKKAWAFLHSLWLIAGARFNFEVLDGIFKRADMDDQDERVLHLKKAISRRTRQKITTAIKYLRQKWLKKSKNPKKPDNHPDLTP